MMNVGSASIKVAAGRWNSTAAHHYVAIAAIGVLAGVAVTVARTPLQLPGHKALYWIAPELATRLITRRPAGGTVGAATTIATTMALGGRLAGGAIAAPLVIAAGVVLDVVARWTERRRISAWQSLAWFAVAGAVANLVCFIKRLLEPSGPFFSAANLADWAHDTVSFASFGALAGVIGAAIALGCRRAARSPDR